MMFLVLNNGLRSFIRQHFFALSYVGVCFWLVLGLAVASSNHGLQIIALHLICFVFFWFLGFFFFKKQLKTSAIITNVASSRYLGFCLTLALAIFSVFHWISLDSLPIFEAALFEDPIDAALVRQKVTQSSSLVWNYATAIAIGSALPFFCLLLVVLKDRFSVHFFIVAVFYTASLLQRAPPLLISIPLVIFLFLSGKSRLALNWFLIAFSAFILVHCVLNGYLKNINVIMSAAHAEQSGQQLQQHNNSFDPWFSLQYSPGKGWDDARKSFLLGEWHDKSGLIFNGKRVVYQELKQNMIIGSHDFDLNFSIVLNSNYDNKSAYGTLLFLGGVQGWDGLFQVQLKFSQGDVKPYIEYIMVNKDGVGSFGYASAPLQVGKINEVRFSRRGRQVDINVGHDVKSYNTPIFDISPPESNKSIMQIGAQFGGRFRAEGESHLDHVVVHQFNLKIYKKDNVIQELDLGNLLNYDPVTLENLIKRDYQIGNSPFLLFSGNVGNLLDRLLFVPGRTGAIWLQLIPSEINYAYGCGYRFVAPLLKCKFINFPVLIHQRVEPELNEQGVHGTMNAAEVFSGYANFGIIGVVMTGAFMAFFMLFLTWLFRNQMRFGASISIPFIAMQSSSGLPVALLSGGWLFSIALFIIFRRFLPPAQLEI